jgi:hypothetical protein
VVIFDSITSLRQDVPPPTHELGFVFDAYKIPVSTRDSTWKRSTSTLKHQKLSCAIAHDLELDRTTRHRQRPETDGSWALSTVILIRLAGRHQWFLELWYVDQKENCETIRAIASHQQKRNGKRLKRNSNFSTVPDFSLLDF